MRHILFISHARGIHGAEEVLLQAVRACASAGARVTVVIPSIVPDEGIEKSLASIRGVKVLTLAYRAAGLHAIRNIMVKCYNLPALHQLTKYVLCEHVDVIYSSSSITILGAALAKKTNIRHIWHWHEPVDVRFGWHYSMAWMYRCMAQEADTIICISHRQLEEWQNTLGVSLSNTRIIYNPIKQIIPMKSEEKVSRKDIRIGFIGHFEKRKNIELLMRAFELVHQNTPNISLCLCGAMSETDYAYVRSMTKSQEPVVTIMPQTSDVASFYNNIDILVLPSWRETMPLVVLEAMQVGVCVLQTNQSGMTELLENGKETLFFSPDNPEELVQLLFSCLNEDFRIPVAKAGQKKALQLVKNTSFDKQITKLLCA